MIIAAVATTIAEAAMTTAAVVGAAMTVGMTAETIIAAVAAVIRGFQKLLCASSSPFSRAT